MYTFLHTLNHAYLDHLLSFSAVFKIPFAYIDKRITKYLSLYPKVNTVHLTVDQLCSLPQSLVHCEPPYHINSLFFLENQYNQRAFHWLSHGESDKEVFLPSIPYYTLKDTKKLIFPGTKAQKIFCAHHTSVWDTISIAGNFRAHAQTFLQREKKPFTILYVPTWDDGEGPSSIHTFLMPFIQTLPPSITLLIKPHPRSTMLPLYKHLETLQLPNIDLLPEYLPLYSYLPIADIVITDRSSISYDACYLNTPLIFLNQTHRSWEKATCCYHAGPVLSPSQYPKLLSYLDKEDRFAKQRQFYGSYAFTDTGGKMVTYSNNERSPAQEEIERS